MKNIIDSIKERILVLDGAMGTMIQARKLKEADYHGSLFPMGGTPIKGDNDVLNLTRPDVIADIHRLYLEAGADIIETNTFSSQRVSQHDYALDHYAHDMALEGARLARRCADEWSTEEKPRYVAGSMGPTNRTLSMGPDVNNPAYRDMTYDQLYDAYLEQASALIEGGVDTLLIETIFDTLNAKAALDASRHAMKDAGRRVPLMLSVTVSDKSGRTLSGQTLEAFLASVSERDVLSVGLNCSFGASQMLPFLRQLAQKAPYYISVYPNAGLPNAMGEYDETPDRMLHDMRPYVADHLVNIIGGCCGTTEHHIRLLASLAEGQKPHQPVSDDGFMHLSGLEPLDVTPEKGFINVGERCNVAGSRKMLRLIKEKNYDEALTIARKQVADGALALDINMDDAMLDAKEEMTRLLNLFASDPDTARVPVMIDSSNWDVIVAGLKCCQGKSIVNSISLKEGEDTFLRHAADVRRYGAAVVVMCFDEEGQAVTYDRKIAIAERSYRLLTDRVGLRPSDIIIDPNILSIATGMEDHDRYALDYIRATKWIRDNLPGAHVSGGVSNLSFSFRGNNYIREAMHAVFLYHAIHNGMDFGIVNPATKVTYDDIPADQLAIIEDAILCRRPGAAEALIHLAESVKAEAGQPQAATAEADWRKQSFEDRLAYALRKGDGSCLEEDLAEATASVKYPHAINIIEGPLMDAMNEVGRLFGEGKMFLPQVVKTARTMKQAVSILQPLIEQEKDLSRQSAGKIVLATVKGDVHDIGKNIVGVILSCNSFEVTDLGIMVPADDIVRTAQEQGADAVGLSGLITPSLAEMVHTAEAMDRVGLRIPLLIGGAATNDTYVALRIAPKYGGPVAWVKDAGQIVGIISKLTGKNGPEYVAQLKERQQQLRDRYNQKQQSLRGLDEARANKPKLF